VVASIIGSGIHEPVIDNHGAFEHAAVSQVRTSTHGVGRQRSSRGWPVDLLAGPSGRSPEGQGSSSTQRRVVRDTSPRRGGQRLDLASTRQLQTGCDDRS
jgi:hypothetical protein